MFIDTEVRVYGDKRAVARLEEIKDRLDNQQVPLRRAQLMLTTANSDNFASNGLPVGGWAPLDAQYGAWKARNFPGTPPMVRTGKLFRSLLFLDSGQFSVITGKSAVFSTDVEYAKFHQYGTSKMPKRKIVFAPVGFAAELGRVMARWTARGF